MHTHGCGFNSVKESPPRNLLKPFTTISEATKKNLAAEKWSKRSQVGFPFMRLAWLGVAIVCIAGIRTLLMPVLSVRQVVLRKNRETGGVYTTEDRCHAADINQQKQYRDQPVYKAFAFPP